MFHLEAVKLARVGAREGVLGSLKAAAIMVSAWHFVFKCVFENQKSPLEYCSYCGP